MIHFKLAKKLNLIVLTTKTNKQTKKQICDMIEVLTAKVVIIL